MELQRQEQRADGLMSDSRSSLAGGGGAFGERERREETLQIHLDDHRETPTGLRLHLPEVANIFVTGFRQIFLNAFSNFTELFIL